MREQIAEMLIGFIRQYAGAGLAGILLGMLLTTRLRASMDAAAKRKSYKHFLWILRRKIEKRGAGEFQHGPEKEWVSELEKETNQVGSSVQKRYLPRMEVALSAYKGATFDGNGYGESIKREKRDAANERAKEKLLESVETLRKCASDWF
jgi:hypothetical protein